MKYDLASGELKDTYKNINKSISLRLGHGYKPSSDSVYCGVVCALTNAAPFYSYDPAQMIEKMWKAFKYKHTELNLRF